MNTHIRAKPPLKLSLVILLIFFKPVSLSAVSVPAGSTANVSTSMTNQYALDGNATLNLTSGTLSNNSGRVITDMEAVQTIFMLDDIPALRMHHSHASLDEKFHHTLGQFHPDLEIEAHGSSIFSSTITAQQCMTTVKLNA